MIIQRDFYLKNPMRVARSLLGAYLCVEKEGQIIRGRICELELYLESERACHAFGGKCTPRNCALFSGGGHAYIYLCYGLHSLFNIVLGPAGTAAAVLIRAVELQGCDGPGKLTKTLGIKLSDNTIDLTTGHKIWVEPRKKVPRILAAKRIGIDYAGSDADLPWRLGIADSKYLSRPF
ncbi:MAG: DNA-3-methyladenine glycosylase [Rickettsiales bacterium]|jgi:DNA-3-methyladenine glycosylase|nr:DNA-3-methyladenine glycosylase [Rickettsiales bacterium]